MKDKEFNRAACFTFFESYLDQAKQIREQMGAEQCADYLISLAEYALYKQEPNNPLTRMLIAGLKNAIDAGQEKRARGFAQENTEQTAAIKKYKQEHPHASYREIAAAVGCSKSKVGKVLGGADGAEDAAFKNVLDDFLSEME